MSMILGAYGDKTFPKWWYFGGGGVEFPLVYALWEVSHLRQNLLAFGIKLMSLPTAGGLAVEFSAYRLRSYFSRLHSSCAGRATLLSSYGQTWVQAFFLKWHHPSTHNTAPVRLGFIGFRVSTK